VKLPGLKADHSPPSGSEVKNCGAIPLLPDVIMAYCLIKLRDSLTFMTTS
jgi:hypothetical protein